MLEILHEVAHREVRGVALAVVAVLFAGLECIGVGGWNHLSSIAQALEVALDQVFVPKGEPPKQHRGRRPLIGGEDMLHRALKLQIDRVKADAFLFGQCFLPFVEQLLDPWLLEQFFVVFARRRHVVLAVWMFDDTSVTDRSVIQDSAMVSHAFFAGATFFVLMTDENRDLETNCDDANGGINGSERCCQSRVICVTRPQH